MTLDLTLDELSVLHRVICAAYGIQSKTTKLILDVILRQMRKKEPSLLKTER